MCDVASCRVLPLHLRVDSATLVSIRDCAEVNDPADRREQSREGEREPGPIRREARQRDPDRSASEQAEIDRMSGSAVGVQKEQATRGGEREG